MRNLKISIYLIPLIFTYCLPGFAQQFNPTAFNGYFVLDMKKSDEACYPNAINAGGPEDQYFAFFAIKTKDYSFVSFDSLTRFPRATQLTGMSDQFSKEDYLVMPERPSSLVGVRRVDTFKENKVTRRFIRYFAGINLQFTVNKTILHANKDGSLDYIGDLYYLGHKIHCHFVKQQGSL